MDSTQNLDWAWGSAGFPVFVFSAPPESSGGLPAPVYKNPAALRDFPEDGFPPLVPGEAKTLASALRGEGPSPMFLHISGGTYTASIVPQGGFLACVLGPVSDYYKDVHKSLDEALTASQAKTSFLSEMSHDIRTPMGAIVGLTDIALAQEGAPLKIRECLEKIKVASGHMMSLLNEVLDMSRIESGRVQLQPEPANIADLLHEILIVTKPQAESAGVDFRLQMGRVCREVLVLDPVRLKQVCLNLLSNAIKYTEKGGLVQLFFSVEDADAKEDMVSMRMVVKDNGIGMSPEFLLKLFSPFEREERSVVNKIQGTGLGMTITKSLIELMGGNISVESELGKGSCFTVTIPFPAAKDKALDFTALKGRRVLLLDSDQRQGGLTAGMLKDLGVLADWAKSSDDAVADIVDLSLEGECYYALLTVEKLPDEEVTLLLPELRALLGQTTRVLLLTSNDWSQIEYVFTRSGVDGYIPLPLFRSRLAQGLLACCVPAGEAPAEQQKLVDLTGKRLLLAEDNELNREIAGELIGGAGAQIDCAENGREAVDLFTRSPVGWYDAVLMDIQMPVMNGLEATKELRALPRADSCRVPIIAMTANAFLEDVKTSLEAGMDAHISKPLDMDKVFSTLEELLGRKS